MDHEQGNVLVPDLWAEGGTVGAEATKKVLLDQLCTFV